MIESTEFVNNGVLLGSRETDWMVGAIQYEERNPSGDWTPYLPPGEWQRFAAVDVLGCVSFSALNGIETQEKFLIGNQSNYSDRFTATMSGTTHDGNYLWKVADSIRKDGLVLESDWPTPTIPFVWEQYYTAIPIDIINKGKKWLETWQVNYEAVPFDRDSLIKHLKHAPIQVVIPGHAILNFLTTQSVKKYFDSYDPWIKEYGPDFVSAQKTVLTRKQTNDMITEQNIDKLYLATLRRLPDADGRAFWLGKSIDSFLQGVLDGEEYKNYQDLFTAGKKIEQWARQ